MLFRTGLPVPGAILAGLGQTLVLSTLVSWQWWWVLASVGDAAITMSLVQMLVTADGYSQVTMSSVAVLASLPQWLVLRRYGLRSVAWFAVPVLAALATVLVYRVQGVLDPAALYIVDTATYVQWLPTVAMIGTIAGLFEGIAVAWILEPEFDRAPAVARSAPRPPVAAVSDFSGVNGVRTCLILLIVLVVPIFMPKMFTETWGFPDAEIVPYALAAVAPWGVSIALLRPGLYHAGLAIAATASIVTAIGMIPAMALVTILKEYVLGDGGYVWVSYAGALGATVTLMIVAVLAVRALRALPESQRLDWAWPTALGGCVGYAVILAATLI